MPATAGRVRMPANNRVHSSAALQTHGIWQSAIGYDPYAPNKDDNSSQSKPSNSAEPDAENAYASFQGLLALARITGSNADEARGACKKCGRVGHLTSQCRNFLSVKEDDKEKDPSAALQTLDRLIPKGRSDAKESSDESSQEESESSDSDMDSDMERIIASRNGKKRSTKVKSSRGKRALYENASDPGGRRKRGRSRKRRSRRDSSDDSDVDSDSDEGDTKRKEKRRKKRHGHSDDKEDGHHHSRKEKRRRRSHKHLDNSSESEESDGHHRRKERRARSPSDSGSSGAVETRNGRGGKRSERKSRKHRGREDN